MSTYTFSFPTLIHFGPGVRNQVGQAFTQLNLKRPLVVTDKGVAEFAFFKNFVKDLEKNGLRPTVFSGVWGNPVQSQVNAGTDAYKSQQADSIIAVGGGAAIDVAKAIALMATHTGNLFDYEDGLANACPIENRIPHWVALPTTAGTGSEVGRSTVVSDDKTHVKKIIFSPLLLAKTVFADPELTLDLPAKMTAATGMDAVTHLVESYLAQGFHPICDGVALEGLRLASKSLVQCVKNPHDLQARGQMLLASMMGAIAFQKGLGLTHSCAHALSTVADLHHGTANGIMIDHALAFNLSAVPERFETLGQTIGLKNPSGPDFLKWLSELKAETGIPRFLNESGVKKDQLDALTEIAFKDVCHPSGPKPVKKEDFRRIFSEALSP